MEKVKIPENLKSEALNNSHLIKNWIENMDKDIKIIEARVVDVNYFGKRVGFIEIDCDYEWNERKINERFFLSGKSVFIAVLFIDEEKKKYFTVLVRQPRIGCGKITLEFPAGMTDDSNEYKKVAVKELEEECGIIAKESELRELSPFINTSQLICDDSAQVFYLVKEEKYEKIINLNNKAYGADEDEFITLKVCELNDVPKLTEDLVTKCASIELINLIKEGKI